MTLAYKTGVYPAGGFKRANMVKIGPGELARFSSCPVYYCRTQRFHLF